MQDVVAILIATAAAAFLIRRGWRRFQQRRSAACGACNGCPANDPPNPPQLVAITLPKFHAEAQRRGGSQ